MSLFHRFLHLKNLIYFRATKRMQIYKPAEHADTSDVAPLVQFFELAHLGDTIQSMVQVYFDKTLVSWLSSYSMIVLDNYQAFYIDRTDFLNAAVREKKKFENSLDNSVAVGLNAGTELLMHQVRLNFSVNLTIMEISRWNTSSLHSQRLGNTIHQKTRHWS